MKYRADITAGSLKVAESRVIADLLLKQADVAAWKAALGRDNLLQTRNPATARRLTKLIRGRLETMGPDLWKMVRDARGDVAIHAVFAAAVKHSQLLGDFLDASDERGTVRTFRGNRGGDEAPASAKMSEFLASIAGKTCAELTGVVARVRVTRVSH